MAAWKQMDFITKARRKRKGRRSERESAGDRGSKKRARRILSSEAARAAGGESCKRSKQRKLQEREAAWAAPDRQRPRLVKKAGWSGLVGHARYLHVFFWRFNKTNFIISLPGSNFPFSSQLSFFFVFHWNSSKCQQKRGFCIWFYPFLSNLLWSHASIPQLSISRGASLSFWLPITRHMVHRPLRCSGLVRALFGLLPVLIVFLIFFFLEARICSGVVRACSGLFGRALLNQLFHSFGNLVCSYLQGVHFRTIQAPRRLIHARSPCFQAKIMRNSCC